MAFLFFLCGVNSCSYLDENKPKANQPKKKKKPRSAQPQAPEIPPNDVTTGQSTDVSVDDRKTETVVDNNVTSEPSTDEKVEVPVPESEENIRADTAPAECGATTSQAPQIENPVN